MFLIEKGILKFNDSEYKIPEELKNKDVNKIYGTATNGLSELRGILLEQYGASGKVLCSNNFIISGHIIDENPTPKNGYLVHLREQIDPQDTNKIFWLISSKKILNELNWIIVEYKDGTLFRLCPFTKYYSIVNNA